VVEARKAFVEDQAGLDAAKLVFIDEAGISVAESRRYGWAPCGVTPVIERPARGRRLNLIGAIALDGVRALRQVDGYVTGDVFWDYLREDLGPTLNEGDIVVTDGPSIHRVAGVVETLAEFGATALYLPAYSPELNPIEMTWAWVKKLVRDQPTQTLRLLCSLVASIWGQVTPDLCAGRLRHSGYTLST
jgi:transposase